MGVRRIEGFSNVVWINGPFGGGKTQTAQELHRRLSLSAVCDPELVGLALQRTLPGGRSTDFQDMSLWRETTRRMLADAAAEGSADPLIIPMTLVVPDYFREIVVGLRDLGITVHHFSLIAPRDVVLRRLRRRLDRGNSWPARQIDRCLEALVDPLFAEQVNTEGKSIQQVAEEIAAHCDLALQPSTMGPISSRLRRLRVQARHIRWFAR